MMFMKPAVACVLACVVVSVAGCAFEGRNAPTPTPLPQVVNREKIIFEVERGPIIAQKEVTAEVVPAQQDELFFRSSGYITRVLFKNGDVIEEGEVLAELELDDLLDQLQQARIDLEVSEDQYATEQLQKAYEIQQAESEVIIWQKQVELARSQWERSGGTQKEAAQLNLDIAQERLKTAQAWLALVEGKVNSEMEQVVQRNQLSVERLERLVAERQLIAPYDGVILNMFLTPGKQVEAYAPVALVGDPTNLVIRTAYDYELYNTLDTSTVVHLYLTKAKDAPYPVQYIPGFLPITNQQGGSSISGDNTSIKYLFFSLPEELPRDQLPTGSRGYLQVIMGSKDDALLVSPAAIRGNDTFKYVIVLEGDYHRRVEVVSIGVKSSDKWEVMANLKEGDQILGP